MIPSTAAGNAKVHQTIRKRIKISRIYVKGEYKKGTTALMECQICGDGTNGKNFDAISCLACAAFFRLSIAQGREYACRKDGKCAMDKANRAGCRHCRLKKCFQVGMRKELVRANNNGAEEGRNEEEQRLPSHLPMECSPNGAQQGPIFGQCQGDQLLLDSLLHMEAQCRRVSQSTGDVPLAYFGQFKCLEDLLGSGQNLLNMASSFSGLPSVWEKAKCLERVEKHGLLSIWPSDQMLDHFLCIDMARSLAFFGQMQVEDQVRLLSAVDHVVINMSNFFYSARDNAETITRRNGVVPAAIIQQTRRYGSDPRLVLMSQRLYSTGMVPFRQVALEREEFVLLLAILFSYSGVPGLSEPARDLLYSNSTKFAGLLLRLLQSRLGILPGVQRYAQIVQLIGLCFQVANYYQTYATYLDIFHLRGNRDKMLPRVLQPLYSIQP